VCDVPGEEPRDEEDTEGDVTGGALSEVFEDFANYNLNNISIPHYQPVGSPRAYREQNIGRVHHTQDDIADLRLVESVAGKTAVQT